MAAPPLNPPAWRSLPRMAAPGRKAEEAMKDYTQPFFVAVEIVEGRTPRL